MIGYVRMGAGGRAVECSGLENRWTFTGPVGSNPTLPVRKLRYSSGGPQENLDSNGACCAIT